MTTATIARSSVETPAHAGEAPEADAVRFEAEELVGVITDLEEMVLGGRLTGRAARRVSLRVEQLRVVVEALREIASEIEGAGSPS